MENKLINNSHKKGRRINKKTCKQNQSQVSLLCNDNHDFIFLETAFTIQSKNKPHRRQNCNATHTHTHTHTHTKYVCIYTNKGPEYIFNTATTYNLVTFMASSYVTVNESANGNALLHLPEK